jgi:hypothetical protein
MVFSVGNSFTKTNLIYTIPLSRIHGKRVENLSRIVTSCRNREDGFGFRYWGQTIRIPVYIASKQQNR